MQSLTGIEKNFDLENSENEVPHSHLKIAFFILFFFIIGSMFVFAYISYFNYVDPFNLCYIKISRDSMRSDPNEIKKAISEIKRKDTSKYSDLCRYVETISEDYCLDSFPETQTLQLSESHGCYLKGSKIIFISPDIKDKVEIIEKYSELSKNYWETR